MKKVVEIKIECPQYQLPIDDKAPALDFLVGEPYNISSEVRRIRALIAFALLTIGALATAGCRKKEGSQPEATSTPTATAVTEYVMNNPTSTPEPTPTSTPMDASFSKPEATATPCPIIILSQNEFQDISKGLIARLSKNFNNNYPEERFAQKYSYDEVVEIMKGFFGVYPDYFVNNANANGKAPEDMKRLFFNDMVELTNTITVLISGLSADNIFNGKKQSYYPIKIYDEFISYSDKYPGIESVGILEDSLEAVFSNIESENDNEFLSEMNSIEEFIRAVYNNENFEYNGVKITNYKDMNPSMKLFFISIARATMITCANKCTTLYGYAERIESIRVFSNSLTSEFNKDGELANEFYALMDAYVALQLESTVVTPSPELVYTPTPNN